MVTGMYSLVFFVRRDTCDLSAAATSDSDPNVRPASVKFSQIQEISSYDAPTVAYSRAPHPDHVIPVSGRHRPGVPHLAPLPHHADSKPTTASAPSTRSPTQESDWQSHFLKRCMRQSQSLREPGSFHASTIDDDRHILSLA